MWIQYSMNQPLKLYKFTVEYSLNENLMVAENIST